MESPEPIGKMDELLKAYAKKRQEEAEPALPMHPATRKLLQDEVKRTWGVAPPPPRQSWRQLRWPLLALGGGFAALMVMLAVINSQMRSLMPANAPIDRVSPTKDPGPSSAPIARRAISPPPGVSSAAAAKSFMATRLAPPALAAKKIASANAPPEETGLGSDLAAGRFVQNQNRNQDKTAPSPAPNVLSAFQMRRSGQNVRIVDADGSVYTGQVLNATYGGAAVGGGGGGARAGTAQTRPDTNADASWRFQVVGVNHRLQQQIVFTGNVQAMPAAVPAGAAAAQNRSALQLQNASGSAALRPAQNSRITGKVQVGGGPEFEIEATPPAQ